MHGRITNLALNAIFLLSIFASGCAHKYAVLISTNDVSSDNSAYHSEWWYDLVLQYKMLKGNGFKDDKIYVLYGSGSDFNTIHDEYNATIQFGHPITTMAVNKANVQLVFNNLKDRVTKKDYLYVWWMGHGGVPPGSCDLSMSISNTGEYVSDTEFSGYINSVANYKKRTVAVMTCHSGGMIDNMNAAGDRTTTLTSSTCAENSYDSPASCDVFHAEFNYTEPSALRLKNPCDAPVASDYNGNGFVSLSETHQYNAAVMTESTPQIGDPDSIGAHTHIKKKKP